MLAPPGWTQSQSSEGERRADAEIRRNLEKFATVFHTVSTRMADAIDPEKAIYEGAVPGAVSQLDPFSVFLDPEQFLALQQQQRGVRQGFGAVLSLQAGKITVLQSIPDSPFGRAGLGPGDRIVSINGLRVASMGLEELVQALQEARGGKVKLSVMQGGGVVPRDFELDPSELPSPTVEKQFRYDGGFGGTAYLHVSRIERSTPEEIVEALQRLGAQDLNGLILDLRDNPGGSLEGAVRTLALFLPEGTEVVQIEGRAVPEIIYRTEGGPRFPSLPMVVIVNEGSASAAEIIAAGLQEHDRAWLVGQATFGKGVAESVLPLSHGAALVLTTARYLTAKGRSVQKPLPGTALAAILEQGSTEFYTDQGRPLQQTGGLAPDEQVEPWRLDEWSAWLQQSTAFINFAQEYLERHGKADEQFRANDEVLQEFERFLQRAGVFMPQQDWRRNLPVLRARVEAEILSLVYGAAKGSEAEVRADPQVQAAAAAMERARELLAGGAAGPQ